MTFRTIDENATNNINKYGIRNSSFADIANAYNAGGIKGVGNSLSSFITSKDLSNIKEFNRLVSEEGVSSQTAWHKTMQTSSNAAKELFDNEENLVKSGNSVILSEKAISTATNTMTFSAKAGQVALKGLALAGNMVVGILAGFVISKAIEGLDNLVHAADNAKESAESFSNSFSSMNDEFNSNNSKLSDLQKKYDELSKGVNSLGENVSLASVLETNPEYIQYLVKVGDQYKLNEQALNDWNEVNKEQKQEINNQMGGNDYLSNYSPLLDSIQDNASHPNGGVGNTNIGSQLDDLINKNKEWNTSLQNGEITTAQYFQNISNAITNSGLEDALHSLNGKFDDSTDYIEETVSVLATQLSDGLAQSTKRFEEGQTSVQDYIEEINAGSDAEKKLLASTYDLNISQETGKASLDGLSGAALEAAQNYNSLVDSQNALASTSGFVDVLSQNAEFLSQYTDEAGNLMDSIFDDSRFNDYISNMSNSIVDFANQNTTTMGDVANWLAETAGISTDQATSIIAQGGEAVQEAVGGSLNGVQSMTSFAMSQVGTAAGNAASAVGSVLSSLAELAKTKFDNVNSEYEAQLKQIDHSINVYDKMIDTAETQGYITSQKYYNALISTESSNISKLQLQYSSLTSARNEAMKAGNIAKYSEEWYSMTDSINSVEEAIQDANKSLIEYKNNLRQVKWDFFDKQEDYISKLQDESDWLKQLGLYDGLVKKYINDADAKSIKSVKIEGRTLKFYKVEEPIGEDVLPAYSITIPETDLTEVNKAIKAVKDVVDKLDGEDTVEGSVKAQIKALKTEIEGKITASEYNDTEIKKSIKANTDAIGVLNGTSEGSVDKKVADAVASIVADAPAAYDTLKEISDWISTHESGASAMNSSIQANKTDIANLAKLVGTLPEGEDSATIVAYIDKKVGAIDFSSAIATAKSEAISEAKKYTDGLAKNYATAEQGTKADTALQEADITDLKADVAANKASLGAEGATTKAIADAKKAGTDAQSNVDALAKRVDTIASTTYIEATDEEINGLFA